MDSTHLTIENLSILQAEKSNLAIYLSLNPFGVTYQNERRRVDKRGELHTSVKDSLSFSQLVVSSILPVRVQIYISFPLGQS
jgi:hypothetical protein